MKKRDRSRQKPALPATTPLPEKICLPQEAEGQIDASTSLTQTEQKEDIALPTFSMNTPHTSSLQYLRKKNRLMLTLSIGLVVLMGLGGLGLWFLKSGIIPPDVSLYQVGTAKEVSLSIGGGGLVYPHQQINISYPSAERVVSVMVKAGDHVTPNQSLLQIDPSQVNVAIKQASDDVSAAQAYLNSVSLAGTSVNIAQAQQMFDLAKNRYNALVSQAASPLLHSGSLVSPMSGVITAVNVNPGEVFPANTTIITIMDENSVVVRVKVPLTNLAQVHLGQDAIVSPSALANVNIPGTVNNIIPQADPQTDTFEVWVSIPNQNHLLIPGMSAFVSIQTPANALLVPRLAVLSPEGDASVFVVSNQVAHLRNVKVVGRSINTIYIGDGLSLGDQIILVGVDGLHDGQHVHVTRTEKSIS